VVGLNSNLKGKRIRRAPAFLPDGLCMQGDTGSASRKVQERDTL